MTDRYTQMLTGVLDMEIAADDWDARPVIAVVFGDKVRCEALAVWVPEYVWAEYDDPNAVMMALAALVTLTGTVPLLRAPEFGKPLGVAFWANAWAANYDDDGGGEHRTPQNRPDRYETKVALFAHLDGRQWRAIHQPRGSTGPVVSSSQDRRPRKITGGPLLDSLRLVANAMHAVRFELP